MTIESIKKENLIVLEVVSGSRAYGTNLPESDLDIKGVFIQPQTQFYGFNYTPQISDEKNDVVYYELKRFIELLAVNNPNILEMLAAPADCIRIKHPLLDPLTPKLVLSKLCEKAFAGYAMTQIRKARGLNKKILNPIAKTRKGVLDFCYVPEGQGSIPIQTWLKAQGIDAKDCGLSKIPHMKNVYGLYVDEKQHFKGLLNKADANEVALSNIPSGLQPQALLSFNREGYSTYCKEYKLYWDWVEKRNEARFENTQAHGKNYDAKNLMHTFRLLHMAEEIGSGKGIQVRRADREFLLQIRRGAFSYEELVTRAEEKVKAIATTYAKSDLPEHPDQDRLEALLVQIRRAFYSEIKA